jgi:hypothetical protein
MNPPIMNNEEVSKSQATDPDTESDDQQERIDPSQVREDLSRFGVWQGVTMDSLKSR